MAAWRWASIAMRGQPRRRRLGHEPGAAAEVLRLGEGSHFVATQPSRTQMLCASWHHADAGAAGPGGEACHGGEERKRGQPLHQPRERQGCAGQTAAAAAAWGPLNHQGAAVALCTSCAGVQPPAAHLRMRVLAAPATLAPCTQRPPAPSAPAGQHKPGAPPPLCAAQPGKGDHAHGRPRSCSASVLQDSRPRARLLSCLQAPCAEPAFCSRNSCHCVAPRLSLALPTAPTHPLRAGRQELCAWRRRRRPGAGGGRAGCAG